MGLVKGLRSTNLKYIIMNNNNQLDSWFLDNLICPVDKSRMLQVKNRLICNENNHNYPIFRKIPIMLLKERTPTHTSIFQNTWDIVNGKIEIEENLSISQSEKYVDSFVQKNVAATNSNLYKNLIGKLSRYPIPNFPISSPTKDKLLLDIGCSWGRWCFSASRSGFISVGIDPGLDSILAAKRIAKQLNINSRFIVADARYLPFRQNLFDYCFSFSVLQHFSKSDVEKVLREIKHVLKRDGISKIQMLNKYGLRSLFIQLKNIFRKSIEFETRYWSPEELSVTFEKNIGLTKILLGSFFTQAQISDRDLFATKYRIILEIAELIKKINEKIPFFTKLGDNLFVVSMKKN